MNGNPLFVTAAPGTADLLAAELTEFGLAAVREVGGGASGVATLAQALRVCLWSRVGLRVLWRIGEFAAADAGELYAGIRGIDWSAQLGVADSLAVDFSGELPGIRHSQFGAQRVKDAIVDQFREGTGERPSVDRVAPALRINVRAGRDGVIVAVDLSGDSLHRRGYRGGQGAAPLKENLAAALLLRAGWPELAAAGGAFVDPLCGSGTLPIEAALIAADIAPGLLRERFGFERWRGHDAAVWRELIAEAGSRRAEQRLEPGRVRGYDRDARLLAQAQANAQRAGLGQRIHFERCDLAALPPAAAPAGLIATNPPYGERLGDRAGLRDLYALLGERLRAGYRGWEAAVLTGNPALGRALGIRARRTHRMMNGPLECRLLRLAVEPEQFVVPRAPGRPPLIDAAGARARPGAAMFANRLRKNCVELGRWARREQIACYRLYDADMPEYAFAIDLYQSDPAGSAGRWLYVQEYAPPATVDRAKARARREEALSVLPEVTGLPAEAIWWRTRRPQKGRAQYEQLGERGERVIVAEGGLRFLVNFTDYLDTGMFLDQRLTRARIRTLARGRRFLNLFCYTGTATVYAAAGGAPATTSVDLSRTYLDWAQRNLEVNGCRGTAHRLVQADCLDWLAHDDGERYGLILLDPPTFSNSKRMRREFDVQRDHVALLRAALGRLARDGVLLFSTPFQRFRLDSAALADLAISDLTATTLPRDFARRPRIHQCFELRFDGQAAPPVASPPP
ncbi:MAG: bifunctional 23S rRNA (guanine(2069)-N(7))-methyltransferase RlmK/23S rRNA (guanine(2445)-N(2))-methyltransferase RlmL [Gammaproteobacteria bacterium]|nr:bifunctional 23S rRNA (guanine(2069)-N(7))-methyltransferase RlmK/23S rRNA (guanine(2445)-N(2))-methyltransferase RlmL [Gammaproteobacteria bacterium]